MLPGSSGTYSPMFLEQAARARLAKQVMGPGLSAAS